MQNQDARAYGEVLTAHHRRTHAQTTRTETGRAYWYEVLAAAGDTWATPVYYFDAQLPRCDETGCDCTREAARQLVEHRPQEWRARPNSQNIRVLRTNVNVIFDGPNGPAGRRQS